MPTLNVASLGGLEGKFQLLEDASAFVVAVLKAWRTHGQNKAAVLADAVAVANDLHIDTHSAIMVADLIAYLAGGPDTVAGVIADLAVLGMPSYLQTTVQAALTALQQAIEDQQGN